MPTMTVYAEAVVTQCLMYQQLELERTWGTTCDKWEAWQEQRAMANWRVAGRLLKDERGELIFQTNQEVMDAWHEWVCREET